MISLKKLIVEGRYDSFNWMFDPDAWWNKQDGGPTDNSKYNSESYKKYQEYQQEYDTKIQELENAKKQNPELEAKYTAMQQKLKAEQSRVDKVRSNVIPTAKRIGAHMGDQYTFYRVDKKGNVTPQVRDIRMLLEHNTMTVGGKKVISLSDIETKTGVKVSDLISQLMNGWVDVAKDAWVFNINGNNIAGPVLLFMLEAGVDYETAVYLTTQPLVVDYCFELFED